MEIPEQKSFKKYPPRIIVLVFVVMLVVSTLKIEFENSFFSGSDFATPFRFQIRFTSIFRALQPGYHQPYQD